MVNMRWITNWNLFLLIDMFYKKIIYVRKFGYLSKNKSSGNSYTLTLKITTLYFLGMFPIYTYEEVVQSSI